MAQSSHAQEDDGAGLAVVCGKEDAEDVRLVTPHLINASSPTSDPDPDLSICRSAPSSRARLVALGVLDRARRTALLGATAGEATGRIAIPVLASIHDHNHSDAADLCVVEDIILPRATRATATPRSPHARLEAVVGALLRACQAPTPPDRLVRMALASQNHAFADFSPVVLRSIVGRPATALGSPW